MGIAFAIMTYGEATLVNILYTSRGIWTIALVWMVGHWFGNTEHTHGPKVMIRRLVGSGLILDCGEARGCEVVDYAGRGWPRKGARGTKIT